MIFANIPHPVIILNNKLATFNSQRGVVGEIRLEMNMPFISRRINSDIFITKNRNHVTRHDEQIKNRHFVMMKNLKENTNEQLLDHAKYRLSKV